MKHVDLMCWSTEVRKHFFKYPHKYRLEYSLTVLDITVVARTISAPQQKEGQGYHLRKRS